jgi:hypothetical protein
VNARHRLTLVGALDRTIPHVSTSTDNNQQRRRHGAPMGGPAEEL